MNQRNLINYVRYYILIFSWPIQIKTYNRGAFVLVVDLLKALRGPKYDGKYLHKLISMYLGGMKLHQTLTNVVIPTFDVKKLQPIIFSSYQVLIDCVHYKNCRLIYNEPSELN